jgi:hypothetical protein
MNAAIPQAQEPLESQVSEALAKLGALDRDLGAITDELEDLAAQRERHALLEQTCGSIERLGELGALNLLFGDDADGRDVSVHLERARRRVAGFHERVIETETRRRAVADEIAAGREVLGILEDDLEELRQEEEVRRNEWVIEREAAPERERNVPMPWVGGAPDDRRLRKH